jgi:hypothetical protein
MQVEHRFDLGRTVRKPGISNIACPKLKIQKMPGHLSLLDTRRHDNLHEFSVDIVRLLARDARAIYA